MTEIIDAVKGVSVNTLILSAAIGIAAWFLKGVAWALAELGKSLIAHVVNLLGKISTLDAKMSELTHAIGDLQKMRNDINEYYKRLRVLERNFENRSDPN